jgi:tRNA pseudouridine65 synthase
MVFIPILFRDEALVVVNKPSGLAVHRGWAHDPHYALDLVRDQIGAYLYPVHRLDRSTSGALVFARSVADARSLQAQFESGSTEKHYLALTRGVTPEHGTIDHPIPRTEDGPRVDACTLYKRLAVWERYSWVLARPMTGRLHQIRRHFKHISHPLIGDVRYGKGEHNRHFRERFGLNRLALHAWRLSIFHPRNNCRLTFNAPLPEVFAEMIAEMGLREPFDADGGPI